MSQTQLAPPIAHALHETELLGMLHSLSEEAAIEAIDYETRGDHESSAKVSEFLDATVKLIEYLERENDNE